MTSETRFKVSNAKYLKQKKRSHSLESSPRFDAKNKHIPVLAAEYAKDIHENFRKVEQKFRPSSTYMSRLQTEVTEKMRTILVDWIVDVHLKFKQLPETLFLAVEIIDRYLDKKSGLSSASSVGGSSCHAPCIKVRRNISPRSQGLHFHFS